MASPRTEDRIHSPIFTCAYLFLAFQVFPMLPGSMITFATLPVYRVYELAPRIGTWTAVNDQQLAGALMAIGCTPVVWALIGVIFIRASEDHTEHDVWDTSVDPPRLVRRASSEPSTDDASATVDRPTPALSRAAYHWRTPAVVTRARPTSPSCGIRCRAISPVYSSMVRGRRSARSVSHPVAYSPKVWVEATGTSQAPRSMSVWVLARYAAALARVPNVSGAVVRSPAGVA